MQIPPANTAPRMFCRKCGYSLVGLPSNRCPECGRDFDPAKRKTFLTHPPRVFLGRLFKLSVILFCLVLLPGLYVGHLYRIYSAEKKAIQFLLRDRSVTIRFCDKTPAWARAILRGHGGWLWERAQSLRVGPSRNDVSTSSIIGAVGKLKCLEQLYVFRLDITDTDLALLRRLTDMQVLRLAENRENQFTGAGLAQIEGMKSLRILDLPFTGATDAALAHLKGFTRLQTLDLYHTKVTGVGLSELKILPDLRNLNLSGTNVSNDTMAKVAALPALQELYLASTKIGNAGLARLTGLSKLPGLNLATTNVNNAGLASLKNFTVLQWIDLEQSNVTGAGLPQLAGLTSLERLNLRWCEHVTDARLAQLKGLKNLTWIDVRDTEVTEAGAVDFQNALPNCEVDYGVNYELGFQLMPKTQGAR
jgi:hypothetical protein